MRHSRSQLAKLFALTTTLVVLCGCQSTTKPIQYSRSKIVQIPVLVVPEKHTVVPRGSRIVIAGIEGDCTNEVKDALMRRLIDNNDYSVLTRDNLKQIVSETDTVWAGRFDTETSARLGRLLGASLWIVGRVVYCGPSLAAPDIDTGLRVPQGRGPAGGYSILVAMQIIDLETGKVLVSSSSEGHYTPRASSKVDLSKLKKRAAKLVQQEELDTKNGDDDLPLPAEDVQASSQTADLKPAKKKKQKKPLTTVPAIPDQDSDEEPANLKRATSYNILKAAEDMANGFADKFFSRPTWEEVEMWSTPSWQYGDAIGFVKLGHCSAAVRFFEETASSELPKMGQTAAAEYLHNYGVALLCANQQDAAVRKLRAAYRIRNSPATVNMMGLAGKLSEWSLKVAPDEEPEIVQFLGTS